jgi:hypothetical protein
VLKAVSTYDSEITLSQVDSCADAEAPKPSLGLPDVSTPFTRFPMCRWDTSREPPRWFESTTLGDCQAKCTVWFTGACTFVVWDRKTARYWPKDNWCVDLG